MPANGPKSVIYAPRETCKVIETEFERYKDDPTRSERWTVAREDASAWEKGSKSTKDVYAPVLRSVYLWAKYQHVDSYNLGFVLSAINNPQYDCNSLTEGQLDLAVALARWWRGSVEELSKAVAIMGAAISEEECDGIVLTKRQVKLVEGLLPNWAGTSEEFVKTVMMPKLQPKK